MAAQLVLVSKATGERRDLVAFDAEICEHFGWPCDPDKWAKGWMDTLGLLLACRQEDYSDSLLEGYYYENELRDISEYIAERYENKSHWTR